MNTIPGLPEFTPSNTIFLLLSFEGPDIYSQAGGLGVRMAGLSEELATEGYETHLFFIGDPSLPGLEKKIKDRLIYHRWCQWVSRCYPGGVYDGEEAKRSDYQTSIPSWILENILIAPQNAGKNVVILGEEWQTAETVILLQHLARTTSHPCRLLFLWNANNTFGFHRINWNALQQAAKIITVSKYMKHLMTAYNINPLVIPNGIPKRWFESIDEANVRALRKAANAQPLLAKIGRFDPSKRWIMAIQSLKFLKQLRFRPKLLMRGGAESHGEEVLGLAARLGLSVASIKLPKNASLESFFEMVRKKEDVDIFDLNFFIPELMLRLIYRSADAVLANSKHEPFGIVGLEVMACRGIAITGNTGEDYVKDFHNGIVVETDDPRELAASLAFLASDSLSGEKLRSTGYESAHAFEWNLVVQELKRKLSYLAFTQNLHVSPPGKPVKIKVTSKRVS